MGTTMLLYNLELNGIFLMTWRYVQMFMQLLLLALYGGACIPTHNDTTKIYQIRPGSDILGHWIKYYARLDKMAEYSVVQVEKFHFIPPLRWNG